MNSLNKAIFARASLVGPVLQSFSGSSFVSYGGALPNSLVGAV
jgi:hypothetical protein